MAKQQPTVLKVEIQLADYWSVSYDEEGEPIPGGEMTDPIFKAVVYQLVAQAVKRPEYASLTKKVAEVRTEMIQEKLEPLIAEAIELPVQRTNTYGEVIGGEPVTIRSIVLDEARKRLAQKDESYHARDRRTFLQKLIHEQVVDVFAKEMQAEIAQAKADATAAVREQAAAVIAETITKMAGAK